uniref:Uncharacterized protein n=1 Tax=Rhizophora mucronata TaxID=61149 RepID=A0A2P2JYY6_RHIMU
MNRRRDRRKKEKERSLFAFFSAKPACLPACLPSSVEINKRKKRGAIAFMQQHWRPTRGWLSIIIKQSLARNSLVVNLVADVAIVFFIKQDS